MIPPHGLAELQARYGRIVLDKGRIVSPIGWERAHMVRMESPHLPTGKLYVNKDMAEPLKAALAAAAEQCPEYRVRTIGGWAQRYKGIKPTDVSVHAWGLAVDINKDQNPQRSPIVTDMPPLFVDAFVREGFTWGGKFPTPDPMHFQWCSGY